MKPLLFGIFATLLPLGVPAAVAQGSASGVQFPSSNSSESPDGRWMLTCKAPAEGATDLRPLLFLTRVGGPRMQLRRIDRDCEILWSPDSSSFAMTDDWASDRSDVIIYTAGRVSTKSLRALFPAKSIPQAELEGHCYFEARDWLDRHHLQIRISGHTDDPPIHNFEHNYIFNVATGTFEIATDRLSPK
jgi:hypothetical protein